MEGPNRNANSRGNRFFLPKIEYARLDNNPKLTDFDLNGYLEEDTKTYEGNKRTERFESQSNNHDQPSATFTKFSVLPPICDPGPTRGKYLRELDRTRSDDKYDQLELDIRNRGSLLRRQSALLHGERDGATKINTGNADLHIIGQGFSGVSPQSTLVTRENDLLLARRPFSTPHASTLVTTEQSTAQHRTQRFKFRRFNSESSQGKRPSYRNTDSFVSSNDNLSLLSPTSDYKRKVSTSGLNVDFPPSRPVSRCHINIDVKKTTDGTNEGENLSSEPSNNNEQNTSEHLSPSAPFVRVSDEDPNNTENNNKPPSIQILIDTLETAKNEIPDKLELPKMSVREQRRRSALCRVNSKQVDDFLLVHNLKDLGLL